MKNYKMTNIKENQVQKMLDAIKSAQFDELILPEINDKNKPTVESKKLPKREK